MDAHGEPITAPFTLLVFPCCEFHWFNYLTCLFPMYAWLLYKEQLLWGETTGNIYAMLLQYFYLCCCFTALCLCFAFIFYWFPHSHIFLFIYVLLRIYVNILHFYSSFSHSHFFFYFFWGFKHGKYISFCKNIANLLVSHPKNICCLALQACIPKGLSLDNPERH